MATAWNISVPPLSGEQRVEDWKPLFMAATSTLVALAGEKAAIQMLPSYLIRRDYEKAIALEAINEETLEQAFSVLTENLDPPIDLYEATSRYRAMQWSVGERIDDFFYQIMGRSKTIQPFHKTAMHNTSHPATDGGSASGQEVAE